MIPVGFLLAAGMCLAWTFDARLAGDPSAIWFFVAFCVNHAFGVLLIAAQISDLEKDNKSLKERLGAQQ